MLGYAAGKRMLKETGGRDETLNGGGEASGAEPSRLREITTA